MNNESPERCSNCHFNNGKRICRIYKIAEEAEVTPGMFHCSLWMPIQEDSIKYIEAIIDNHTCDICKQLDGLPIVRGGDCPPHQNCTNDFHGCRCAIVKRNKGS
jgi:hypothetical protein